MGAVNGLAVIGVDLGQKQDTTAVCVAEPESRDVADRAEVHFLVRHLERLPLGTPYPRVAERIGAIAERVRRRQGSVPVVYVDATGVGQPVVDLLRQHGPRGAFLVPVCFTRGDRRSERQRGSVREVTLGKAYLVRRLVTLLRAGRLHLPGTSEAQALVRELLDYEVRIDPDARDRYGAFRVGTHDDLVTALGLAVQTDPTAPPLRGAAVTLRPRR